MVAADNHDAVLLLIERGGGLGVADHVLPLADGVDENIFAGAADHFIVAAAAPERRAALRRVHRDRARAALEIDLAAHHRRIDL